MRFAVAVEYYKEKRGSVKERSNFLDVASSFKFLRLIKELEPWTAQYLEDKFSSPNPWNCCASQYEQMEYQRQIDITKDCRLNPQRALEIGSAEGGQIIMLAEHPPSAKITCIELSSNAMMRSRESLKSFGERITPVIEGISIYEAYPELGGYDVCTFSERAYPHIWRGR
jgi:cyclopropane fatty-acyl-phospholipid synthase-like methyltransferase